MFVLFVFGGSKLNAQKVKIGETEYETFAAAITAATAGQTITFIDNVNENVTINKSLTIDGANKNYTGTMTTSGTTEYTITVENVNFVSGKFVKPKNTGSNGNYTFRNCIFDGNGLGAYAVDLRGTSSIVIENVTCRNYGYGMLQVPSSATSIVVKDVEISDVYYGLKIDYANAVSLENVTINPSTTIGIYDSNYGAKTYTIKNCHLSGNDAPIKIWERNQTVYTTFNFVEGVTTLSSLPTSKYAKITGTGAQVAKNNGGTLTDIIFCGTLAEALPFVENSNYLKLLSDVELESDNAFNINGNFTLDYNNKTIKLKDTEDHVNFVVENNGILRLEKIGDNAATAVLNDNCQLYVAKSIPVTIKKNIEEYVLDAQGAFLDKGWYTISAPFSTQNGYSPEFEEGYELFRYNEPQTMWENHKIHTYSLELGHGYLYAHNADKTLTFEGDLNVNPTTVALTAQASGEGIRQRGFNLIGNPFSHNITKANVAGGTLSTGYYVLSNHGAWSARKDSEEIATAAGFLVHTQEDCTVTISDNVSSKRRSEDNGSIKINVANNAYSDVAYVSFNDDISLAKIVHHNENVPMVYIPSEGNDYAIACMSIDVEEIPFSFEAKKMGTYTISIDAQDCEFSTMTLVDRLTGVETNMLIEDYSFIARSSDDEDRFILRLSKETIDSENDTFAYINNNELIIDNASSNANLQIFDVLGRPVSSYNVSGSANITMQSLAKGVYILRLTDESNVRVQKVFVD